MRQHHLLSLAALTMALSLGACSSGGDPSPDGDGGSGSETSGQAGGDGPTASSGPGAEGDTRTVSVASITLPPDHEWQEKVSQSAPDIDEKQYFVADDSGKPFCVVTLAVQSDLPGTMDAYVDFLRTSHGEQITSLERDEGAPEGTEGVVVTMEGPVDESSEQEPFSSALRTYLTEAKTTITVSATVNDSQKESCDPEQIVSTLTWDGTERETTDATS